MPDKSPQAVAELLKALYSDLTLEALNTLENAVSVEYGIGEKVSAATTSVPDDKLILVSGKIRVLQRTAQSKDQTLRFITPGDIWDASLGDSRALTFSVSSDEALICQVPASFIMQNPGLELRWRNIHLEDSSDRALEPAPIEKLTISLLPSESTSESPHLSGSFSALSNLSGVEEMFRYYKMSLPKLDQVRDLPQLLASLGQAGLQVQQKQFTWQNLLNTEYPLLLVDANGGLHWITAHQGNTLNEEKQGQPVRFIPDNVQSDSLFSVLKVAKANTHANQPVNPLFSMGWYLGLCLQNGFLTVQMVIASVMIQLFALGTPIFYMVIFDRVFGRQNLSTLDVMAIGLLMLVVFDLLVKLMRSYVLTHLLEFIDKVSMDAFLDRIFHVALSQSDPQTIRSYAERFPELTRLNQALVTTFLVSSMDVVFSVFLVVFLISLHAQLALISLASLIPISLVALAATPGVKKRALQFNREQRVCQLKLSEVLEHNETIQSLNLGNILKQKTSTKLTEHLYKGFRSRFDRVSGPALQSFFASLGTIVTLYFGAHEVLEGRISYGVYMAINMLGRQVIGSVQGLLSSFMQFQEAKGDLDQLQTLFQQEHAVKQQFQGMPLTAVQGHIRLCDVRFRYRPETPWVLNGINVEILPGEKVVLVGASGSGKTTMIRLLQRLYDPSEGQIFLDNVNLRDIDLASLRQYIGVALQKPAVFSGTLYGNITIGTPSASMKEIMDAVNLSHLDDFLVRLPQGFDTPIAPMGANLSGGEIARIALARLLLQYPNLLVLDEALAPCDPSLQSAIYNQLFQRFQHATCLFVTDYLPVHQRADKILVLHQGKIIEQGTYRELVRNQGYYTLLHQTATSVEKSV